jgi:hypothetical protein
VSAEVIPCSECKHPTRGQRVPIAKAPGTFVRKGTLCWKCYEKVSPKKDYRKLHRERMAAGVGDVRHTIVGLEGFMAERRARIEARGSK